MVSCIDRKTLIPYNIDKQSKFNKDKFSILIVKHYTSVLNLDKIIKSSFNKILNKNEDLNLKMVNKIGLNLEGLLINRFSTYGDSMNGTVPCKGCSICGVIYKGPSFFINNYKLNLDLKCLATCESTNVVYIISCDVCNKFYIGETEKSLSIRIKQHLNTIRKFIPYHKYHDKIVAKHFRMKGHSLANFKCCIFKKDLINPIERKSVEKDLIRFLNLTKLNCINLDTSEKVNFLAFATD